MNKVLIFGLALALSTSAYAVCENGHWIEYGAGTVTVNGQVRGEVRIDHGISEQCLDVALKEREALSFLDEPLNGTVEVNPQAEPNVKKESFAKRALGGILGDSLADKLLGD